MASVAFCLTLLLLSCAFAMHEIPVFRMAHYEHGGQQYGSQKASFALPAALYDPNSPDKSFSKSCAIVRAEEVVSADMLEALVKERSAGAVLVVMPRDNETNNAFDSAKWQKIEEDLVAKKIDVPVYFAFHSPTVEEVYATVSASLSSESFNLAVTLSEPKKLSDLVSTTLEATLEGANAPGDEEGEKELPESIIVAAHVDSFGIAPMVGTSVSEGLGALALVELAHRFSEKYSTPKGTGRPTLTFLLENAGKIGFSGSAAWAEERLEALSSNGALVLCLDALASSGEMRLVASRSDKDPRAKRLFELFSAVASEHGVPFSVVHARINVSDPHTPYQHEVFAKKRLLAATLSQSRSSPFPFGALESTQAPDHEAFLKNVAFVSDVLTRLVYGENVVDQGESVSFEKVRRWSKALSTLARPLPYTQSSPLLDAIEKELTASASLMRKTWPLPSVYTFYSQPSATMSAYKSKGFLFDITLFAAVVAYLFALNVYLKGVSGALEDVTAFFRRRRRVGTK